MTPPRALARHAGRGSLRAAARASRALCGVALLICTGCDRRLEPWVPWTEEPPPVQGPLRVPGLENPPPQARVMAPSVAGRRITGTVRLEEGLEPIPNAVLFVIARSSEGGPPLAVRRLVPRTFPVEFELGPEDAMIPGRPFDGPLRLSARLDADGDPMTRGPRDLAVEAGPVVSGSASGVELILRRGS